MATPDVEMVEFFDLYGAERVTKANREKVYALCGTLIAEERDEFIEAREKLKTLEEGSDEWFAALAHCMKELNDMKYVTRYTGHASHQSIVPSYHPDYQWNLTGVRTSAVLNDLKVLETLPTDHEITEERLRLLKRNLGILLSAIDQMAYDLGASPETAKAMFALVHESNKNKRWSDGKIHKDPKTGKVKKPEGFVGPEAEIEKILRRTVTETSKVG